MSSEPSGTTSASPAGGSEPLSDGTPTVSAHGPLWYTAVLALELGMIAGLVIVTRYTVQYRSGLNEPDKVRRIWARAPEIRFQPVVKPLVFAIAVSYGAQSVLMMLITSLLALVGLAPPLHSSLHGLLSILVVGLSSLISIVLYRATGGSNWKVCALSTFGFDLFMEGVLYNLGIGAYASVGAIIGTGSFVGFLVLVLMVAIVLAMIQIPFYIWGAYKRLPSTARLIYNTTVVPDWVKLDRTILMLSAPLAFITFVAFEARTNSADEGYFSGVVDGLSRLMVLAAAALASIISVNRALLANEFQWQWRAFLTPAIPLLAMGTIMTIFFIFTGRFPFSLLLFEMMHVFLSTGSSGVLGAYVYLKLAERWAQSHIDDDILAQDDLLAEFEEDEDNEELEV